MNQTDVAFVGVGAIGLPMAMCLKASGLAVLGVDPGRGAAERALATDLVVVPQFSQAADARFVLVMVANRDQLTQVVDEAVTMSLTGQRWVVMSTVGPDALRVQAPRLVEAGAIVVDMPVTGGVARARTGSLTLFAAGESEAINAARRVLDPLGTLHVVGDSLGQGQSIKLVNQLLCSVHLVAAAEALAFAKALGLEAGQVLGLVEEGAAASWMLSDRGPRMLQDTNVAVTSTVSLFMKDSSLVEAAALETGLDVPLLFAARARFVRAFAAGLGDRDDSRVIETYL